MLLWQVLRGWRPTPLWRLEHSSFELTLAYVRSSRLDVLQYAFTAAVRARSDSTQSKNALVRNGQSYVAPQCPRVRQGV